MSYLQAWLKRWGKIIDIHTELKEDELNFVNTPGEDYGESTRNAGQPRKSFWGISRGKNFNTGFDSNTQSRFMNTSILDRIIDGENSYKYRKSHRASKHKRKGGGF